LNERPIKTAVWVGPTPHELREFPQPVQRAVGLALYIAQLGETPPDAKVLKGFGGAGVLELVEHRRGGTCRAVYTVRFATRIHVRRWPERLYAGQAREG
jgi:phage-related protein